MRSTLQAPVATQLVLILNQSRRSNRHHYWQTRIRLVPDVFTFPRQRLSGRDGLKPNKATQSPRTKPATLTRKSIATSRHDVIENAQKQPLTKNPSRWKPHDQSDSSAYEHRRFSGQVYSLSLFTNFFSRVLALCRRTCIASTVVSNSLATSLPFISSR